MRTKLDQDERRPKSTFNSSLNSIKIVCFYFLTLSIRHFVFTTITIFAVGLKARLLCVCVRNATRNTENKNKKKNKKRNKNSAATLLLFVLKIRRSKKSPKKRHRNSALSNGCPPCDHLIYQHRPRQLNYNIPDYTINTTRSLAARFAAACRFSMKPFEIESTESTESTVMLIFVRAQNPAQNPARSVFLLFHFFFLREVLFMVQFGRVVCFIL